MEIDESKRKSIESNKYRRVYPIFGVLLYYLGALITSLEVTDNLPFLVQILAFSIILIVGLIWQQNKWVVILGEIMVIVASVGPVVELAYSLLESVFGYGALGGFVMLVGIIFHVIGIIIWAKE